MFKNLIDADIFLNHISREGLEITDFQVLEGKKGCITIKKPFLGKISTKN